MSNPRQRLVWITGLLVAFLFVYGACRQAGHESGNVLVLDDFESPQAAERWEGAVSIASDMASHGSRSLRVELSPKEPQFSSTSLASDWSGRDLLLFDLHTETEGVSTASLRIYDEVGGDADVAAMDDYFEGRSKILLQKGWTHVEVNLRPLKAATFTRDIDLSRIRRFQIAFDNARTPAIIHIDNIRVVSGDEGPGTRSRMEAADLVSMIDNRWVTARQVARPEDVPEGADVAELRRVAERELSYLRIAIEAARTQGLDTVYQERSLVVADAGLGVRPLLPWFNRDDRKREMFQYVSESCRRSRHELEDLLRGATPREEVDDTQLDGPEIPPLPHLKGRKAQGWFFRDENNDPLMVLSAHSPSSALQRFFATPLQHIESYTVGGGSRWTIDQSPVYSAFHADPDTHRVGWDGWCGHLVRDLDSMGGTKKENVVICLEHPAIKKAISEYIRLNIAKFHENPELLYDIMAYELSYMCYCARSQGMFHQWLARRHGSVTQANGKWGTQYASFDEVVPPPVKNSRPLPNTNRAIWYDWARFNMDRFTDHLLWVRGEIRRVSPDSVPLAAGGSSYMLSGSASTSGIDEERIVNEVDDLIIHEGGGSTMGMDLQMGLSNEKKPLADPEMSLQGVEYLLPHFLHGKSVAQIYHWPAQPANEYYSNNSSSIVHSWRFSLADVDELLRVALDVRRLNKEVAAFVDAPAEAAILYSQTSTIQIPPEMVAWRTTPYLAALRKTYEASQFLDSKVTFVTERQLLSGIAKRYKILMVPGARNMPADVVTKLWEYAMQGGHVVIMPESLLGNEYNQPQSYLAGIGVTVRETARPKASASGRMVQGYDQSFSEAVEFEGTLAEDIAPTSAMNLGTLKAEGVRQKIEAAPDTKVLYQYSDGSPAILTKSMGLGTVTYSAVSLDEVSYGRLLDSLFESAKITRPLRVRSKRPVEARYATLGDRRLLYLVNFENEPVEITVDAAIQSMQELRDGRGIRGNRVTVPAKQTLILEVF